MSASFAAPQLRERRCSIRCDERQIRQSADRGARFVGGQRPCVRRIAVYQAVIDALPSRWKDPALDFLGCSQKHRRERRSPRPRRNRGPQRLQSAVDARPVGGLSGRRPRCARRRRAPPPNIIDPSARPTAASAGWRPASSRSWPRRRAARRGRAGSADVTNSSRPRARPRRPAARCCRPCDALLPVADGVIGPPLIGVLNPVRVGGRHPARRGDAMPAKVVIVGRMPPASRGDDAPPLAGLVDSARGVALLGATCMLTGIRPAVARARNRRARHRPHRPRDPPRPQGRRFAHALALRLPPPAKAQPRPRRLSERRRGPAGGPASTSFMSPSAATLASSRYGANTRVPPGPSPTPAQHKPAGESGAHASQVPEGSDDE